MSSLRSFDIFCRVVDNLGDIGVCWRLARQLTADRQASVRLWVDDLASLHLLCAQIDSRRACQQAAGIKVLHWQPEFPEVTPADVVVEAFGCGLPERYVEAMAARNSRSLWIVLEYLSAEPWVREHHGLPSPHPRLPLQRYFFFPGFVCGTGGVLRETDLFAQRAAFGEAERRRFWASAGFDPPAADATVVSFFAYAQAPVINLLAAWAQGKAPMVAAIAESSIVGPVLDFLGAAAPATGRAFRRGSLEVRILPFVEQPYYDQLLWACDCNFVRGEDSFVRAQWAARPFVWHIYPQQERVHWRKLEAFLDLYCDGLPEPAAEAVRELWQVWNSQGKPPQAVDAAWRAYWQQRRALEAYASAWTERLAGVGELAGKLARFCQDRIK